MNRRSALAVLGSLPFMGWLKPKPAVMEVVQSTERGYTFAHQFNGSRLCWYWYQSWPSKDGGSTCFSQGYYDDSGYMIETSGGCFKQAQFKILEYKPDEGTT